MSWVTIGVTTAIGAVRGKVQHDAAKRAEDADRKLAAETARYSPWTGMQPGAIKRAGSEFGSIFDSGLQGATTGAMLRQNMNNTEKPTLVGPAGGGNNTGLLGNPDYAKELGNQYAFNPMGFKR